MNIYKQEPGDLIAFPWTIIIILHMHKTKLGNFIYLNKKFSKKSKSFEKTKFFRNKIYSRKPM